MAVIAGGAALDYSLRVRMGGPAQAAGYNVYGRIVTQQWRQVNVTGASG